VRRARIARDADRSRAVVSGGGTGGVRDAAEAVERDRAPVSRERRFERTTKPLNPQSEPRFQRLLKGNAGELTFRRLLHPRDTRRAPWRTGDVRVNRARPLAACEGGRRSSWTRACVSPLEALGNAEWIGSRTFLPSAKCRRRPDRVAHATGVVARGPGSGATPPLRRTKPRRRVVRSGRRRPGDRLSD
jgi:hypothetical protein